MGKYMVFPAHSSHLSLANASTFDDPRVREFLFAHDPKQHKRLVKFAGQRSPIFYDETLQNAHHIHIRGDSDYRVLQHHYGACLSLALLRPT